MVRSDEMNPIKFECVCCKYNLLSWWTTLTKAWTLCDLVHMLWKLLMLEYRTDPLDKTKNEYPFGFITECLPLVFFHSMVCLPLVF